MNFSALIAIFFHFVYCGLYISATDKDFFYKDEAFLPNYRVKEFQDSGYEPLYLEIENNQFLTKALPIFSDLFKISINVPSLTERSSRNIQIAFGCSVEETLQSNALVGNSDKYDIQLYSIKYEDAQNNYLNTDTYRCRKPLIPTLVEWSIRTFCGINGVDEQKNYRMYSIGFTTTMGPVKKRVVIADVCYDETKKVVFTRHSLYGPNLPASRVESSTYYHSFDGSIKNKGLLEYYKTNGEFFEKKIKQENLHNFTPNFVPALLIPEFDMLFESWLYTSQLHHVSAPIWRELYENTLLQIEQHIRKTAYYTEKSYDIFSVVMGQLKIRKNNSSNAIPLFLDKKNSIPVPAYYAKVMSVQSLPEEVKSSIALIFHNVPSEKRAFEDIYALCGDECKKYGWPSDNLYYCCRPVVLAPYVSLPSYVTEDSSTLIYYSNKRSSD